jgi:hypothetical protein
VQRTRLNITHRLFSKYSAFVVRESAYWAQIVTTFHRLGGRVKAAPFGLGRAGQNHQPNVTISATGEPPCLSDTS